MSLIMTPVLLDEGPPDSRATSSSLITSKFSGIPRPGGQGSNDRTLGTRSPRRPPSTMTRCRVTFPGNCTASPLVSHPRRVSWWKPRLVKCRDSSRPGGKAGRPGGFRPPRSDGPLFTQIHRNARRTRLPPVPGALPKTPEPVVTAPCRGHHSACAPRAGAGGRRAGEAPTAPSVHLLWRPMRPGRRTPAEAPGTSR